MMPNCPNNSDSKTPVGREGWMTFTGEQSGGSSRSGSSSGGGSVAVI